VVTWRLAVVAAVASLVAAFLPVGAPLGLLIVDGVLLVLAVVDWALTVPPGRVPVGRRLPESLVMEETGRIEWDVSNPGTRPLRMALADELAPSLRARTRRVEVVLEPAEARSLSTELVPGRRGAFSPSELVVRTYGPLGLAGRQAARRLESRMRVLPLFRSRREAELRMDRARILEVGLRSARFRGGGTEFEQLRDYTVDDEFRRMDWAATARSGRPIVRDFRAERNQVVLLLLDNGRIMAGQVAGVPRVEHAMDAVMTVTAVATRFGDRVGLVAFDRQVRNVVLPANRPGQRRRVVDAIYALEPALVESDYRRAFLETLVRFPRRAMLVLLTELADEAMQETLLSSLPLILRRHLVVVGAVRDPAVETWAGAVPTEAAASYRKAAAIAALDRRRLFSAQLARLGVDVVDAPPGRLAGQLADRYLQVKATGRL
jgi:uncharacterized protein (DUF58 family)